jgi:hypothetical protein
MPFEPQHLECTPASPFEFIRTTWHFLALAMWGGVANYAARVKGGTAHAWSIFELAGEMVISGFVGTLAYVACKEFAVTEWITAATVGMAGHLGSRSVFILERILRAKFARVVPDLGTQCEE